MNSTTGRDELLHRLRSALARVKGEAQLLAESPDNLLRSLESAFAALTRLEMAEQGVGRVWIVDDDQRLAEITAVRLARAGLDAVAVDGLPQPAGADEVLLVDLSVYESWRREGLAEKLNGRRIIVVSGAVDARRRLAALGVADLPSLMKPLEVEAVLAGLTKPREG